MGWQMVVDKIEKHIPDEPENTAIKAQSHNYKGSVMPLQSRDNDIVAPCTYIWGTRASPTPDKTTYMGDGASPTPINCVRMADTLLHKPYKITK